MDPRKELLTISSANVRYSRTWPVAGHPGPARLRVNRASRRTHVSPGAVSAGGARWGSLAFAPASHPQTRSRSGRSAS
jgi:hypothetical protein